MSETLTDLMKLAATRHDASGRRLAEIAVANGLEITHTTVNRILSGTYRSKVGPKTIEAIAYLAGVDTARAYMAAGLPIPGRPFANDLPPGSDYLTPRQRAAVIEVIRAMLEPRSVETVGEAEFLAALSERVAEQGGAHSVEERLAALEQAAETVQRSRTMSAETKALIAEMISDIRQHMRQDRTG